MEVQLRVKHNLFKSYRNSSVEYHAGGYFVRKEAMYLFFDSENSLILFERNEGLYPDDYTKLLEDLQNKNHNKYVLLANSNLLKYKKEDKFIQIMPSIFNEQFSTETVTEILVDWEDGTTQLFQLVYHKPR